MRNAVWSSEHDVLADAIRNADGRVFQTRSGDIVDDVTNSDDYVRLTDDFPAYSKTTGWYYQTDGRLYSHREADDDIVAVRVSSETKQDAPSEETPNPDFLRLVEYAKDAEAAAIIEREYAGYRLLESMHLKMLGHTGKRKAVTWESAATLRGMLDIDRMCDAIPWTIAEGDDIHAVFEQHRPGSCMRDSCKHDLRQLYALNPDKVKTAYIAKGSHGLLQSSISCLVWYGKEAVYIDRRYTDGYLPGVKNPLICSLARQLKMSSGKDVLLVWKGDDIPGIDTISSSVQFKLNRGNNLMPWCDSVRYVVDYDDDTVTLSTAESNDRMCCQDQSGTDITEHSKMKCCSCGCRIGEEECRVSESGYSYCDSCYDEEFAFCAWSDAEYSANDVNERRIYSYGSRYQHSRYHRDTGRLRVASWHDIYISDDALSNDFYELANRAYCHRDLAIEDNRGEYHCPDEDTYRMTEDGEAYHPDDVVTTFDHQCHPKENCTLLHNGDWCLTDDAVDIDGEWYHQDDVPEDTSEDTSEDEQTTETNTLELENQVTE